MRVHLVEDPSGDRIARVLDGTGHSPEEVAGELTELADEYRGEAVRVILDDAGRAALVRLLTGRSAPAAVLERDADGWRVATVR